MHRGAAARRSVRGVDAGSPRARASACTWRCCGSRGGWERLVEVEPDRRAGPPGADARRVARGQPATPPSAGTGGCGRASSASSALRPAAEAARCTRSASPGSVRPPRRSWDARSSWPAPPLALRRGAGVGGARRPWTGRHRQVRAVPAARGRGRRARLARRSSVTAASGAARTPRSSRPSEHLLAPGPQPARCRPGDQVRSTLAELTALAAPGAAARRRAQPAHGDRRRPPAADGRTDADRRPARRRRRAPRRRRHRRGLRAARPDPRAPTAAGRRSPTGRSRPAPR